MNKVAEVLADNRDGNFVKCDVVYCEQIGQEKKYGWEVGIIRWLKKDTVEYEVYLTNRKVPGLDSSSTKLKKQPSLEKAINVIDLFSKRCRNCYLNSLPKTVGEF